MQGCVRAMEKTWDNSIEYFRLNLCNFDSAGNIKAKLRGKGENIFLKKKMTL